MNADNEKLIEEVVGIEPQPKGKLILRTLAMPADTNPEGDIFGGWLMSQMDIAGGMLARDLTHSRITTVAVDSIRFYKPVHVGDAVCCYGELLHLGNTSLTLELEVWIRLDYRSQQAKNIRELVTRAAFTYVALDESGKKKSIDRSLPDLQEFICKSSTKV